jgi:hypothetical protein
MGWMMYNKHNSRGVPDTDLNTDHWEQNNHQIDLMALVDVSSTNHPDQAVNERNHGEHSMTATRYYNIFDANTLEDIAMMDDKHETLTLYSNPWSEKNGAQQVSVEATEKTFNRFEKQLTYEPEQLLQEKVHS